MPTETIDIEPFRKLRPRLQDYLRSWMYDNTEDYAFMFDGRSLEELSFEEIGRLVESSLSEDLEIVKNEIEKL